MKLGIVGLPNVGKSTLFNALTGAGAQAANYPFCTIDPNVGVVAVPDKRLEELTRLYDAVKTTPAVIEFVDIAGLVKGAAQGEGLGNKFLSHIREVDAIVHVVRCFENTDIVHVDKSVDPVRDVEVINMELMLSDLELLEKRLERGKKRLKGDKDAAADIALTQRLIDALGEGTPARLVDLTEEERAAFSDSPLLSMKPVIYAANIGEEDIHKMDCPEGPNDYYRALKAFADKEGSEILPVCAQLESELSELDEEDKLALLADYGLSASGLDRLIRASYKLLGLISYLTAGKPEVRAWTIKNGTTAPAAAGKIHSDFEKGFIRAEVISYEDLIALGSIAAAKEKGLVRSEGKEYIMKDGDVVLFRFNV